MTKQVPSQTVFRVVTVAIVTAAALALLGYVIIEVRETIRWLIAGIFLALALGPAVGLIQRISIRGHGTPRWLAIALTFVISFAVLVVLSLSVFPPLVSEVEKIGSEGPTYVKDLEEWANNNDQFNELNAKYDLTATLNAQVQKLPGQLGNAANEFQTVTFELLENLLSIVTVVVIAFFLLLEGPGLMDRFLRWLGPRWEVRGREIGDGVYGVVKGYVTVNLSLAIVAGLFTWGVLEILGVKLAVPLAILIAFFDLIPLIGLSIGALLVGIVTALHDFPTALIVWVIAFLIFQQLQDRVVQPMLYGKAVKVNPLVAVLVLLAGAQIAGILGALLAIPVAASIAVVVVSLREEPEFATALADDPNSPGKAGGAGPQPAAPGG